MARQVGKFRPYFGDDAMAVGRRGPGQQGRPRRALGNVSGTELVRARIALEVRLGVLETGDRLPDAGVISGALAVSEITVRRALEVMCQDGLLERRRGRAGGTFVAPDWSRAAWHLRDAVAAAGLLDHAVVMEAGLVALAGPVEADRLETADSLCRQMVHAGGEELALLDTRFHLALADALGGEDNRERLADLLGRLCLLAPPPTGEGLNASNELLLEGLRAGDLEAAVSALRAHDAILREHLVPASSERTP